MIWYKPHFLYRTCLHAALGRSSEDILQTLGVTGVTSMISFRSSHHPILIYILSTSQVILDTAYPGVLFFSSSLCEPTHRFISRSINGMKRLDEPGERAQPDNAQASRYDPIHTCRLTRGAEPWFWTHFHHIFAHDLGGDARPRFAGYRFDQICRRDFPDSHLFPFQGRSRGRSLICREVSSI